MQKEKSHVRIDINKLLSKIWLTNDLCGAKNFPSILYSKLYRCDENALFQLWNSEMPLDEFKLWATKFHRFFLYGGRIVDNNGSTVMLENILESIPNVKTFAYAIDYKFTSTSASTMKNISKLKNLDNLILFELLYIPEIFRVEDLSDFINAHKNVKISLNFWFNLSHEYKYQLDKLIDKIIASEKDNCVIQYPGHDYEKYNIMKSRYYH